jgi:3-isopropylmalate/(R)-2-methylmalate dehydratase large subunit
MTGRTLFEKIWDAHVVTQEPGSPAVLYVDLHLIHEVTSPQAFAGLRQRGIGVRRPDLTVATMDHSTPTNDLAFPFPDDLATKQVRQLGQNAAGEGIRLYGLESPQRGIVHVIGPELGLTQPGMTIVCGDSHTSTHGAFGALAFGIGTSEVEHVLATQCLLQRKPKVCEVKINGTLPRGVTAKDVILALLAKIGVGGGTGFVFEYSGNTVRGMSMEERMTLCNMSIEGGARAGMVAPDDTTFEYLSGREFSPRGKEWDKAIQRWKALPTDPGAAFDKTTALDASDLVPMVTFGTNPGMGIPVTGMVPSPASIHDPAGREALAGALRYMGLQPGKPVAGTRVDVVFIGSCTNCSRGSPPLHGTPARQARGGDPGRCGLHWQLHQFTDFRPSPGSVDAPRTTGLPERQDTRRSRLRAGEAAGGNRRARRGLPCRRRRMERGRVLDVHSDERRPDRRRAECGEHEQSEF